ncbi:hypothetical protein HK105_201283 [Polyrhizophydium stewartii]|uniref:Uncharacterized protein n=1 Tax=Polyrhizophydium stewartii TaxID=2732419 RepID=A0ABR4NHL0_9FUNG
MPRINVNLEVIKFGLYIFFPIGVLYLQNRPDIIALFPTSQDTLEADRKENQKYYFKGPQSKEEIDEQFKLIVRNAELRKKAAAASGGEQ